MLDSRWQEDFCSLAAPSIAPDPPAFSSDFAEYLHVSRSTSGSSIKSGNEEQSFCDHKMYDVVENREPSIREPMRRAFWNDTPLVAPRRFYRRVWIGIARRLTKQKAMQMVLS